jgi:hypothetical protein
MRTSLVAELFAIEFLAALGSDAPTSARAVSHDCTTAVSTERVASAISASETGALAAARAVATINPRREISDRTLAGIDAGNPASWNRVTVSTQPPPACTSRSSSHTPEGRIANIRVDRPLSPPEHEYADPM